MRKPSTLLIGRLRPIVSPVLLALALGIALPAAAAQAAGGATLTNPLNGQSGVSASTPFTWTTYAGAQGYYLTIGTSAGAYDVLASGELPATPAAYTVPVTLPTGSTLYARLYTKVNGAYSLYSDSTFTAATAPDVTFTYPTNGQTGVDTTKPLTWSTIAAATNYVVTVGTSVGAWDLVASGELPATQSSYPMGTLPTGQTLYARIWSKVGGWYSRYSDITFTAAPPAPPPALPALTTTGNKIMATGQPFAFHGVNRDSLEWGQNNWMGCAGDGNFTDNDFNNMKAWKVTAVRLPLAQANWLGRRCNAASYKATVDAAIAKANARGMYAIVDLHWSDVSGRAPCDANCWSGQQPMPDADSLVFWQQVAARYANKPGVIFDLYNEPHDVSWSCWRNGGCTVPSSTLTNGGTSVNYTAVGMQQLYDAVRAQGANNLVLAAGLSWAYDLSGVGAGYALDATNLAYDTHVYTQFHNTAADWDQHFGFLTATKPVTATEFGSGDCSTNVTAPLLDYFQARGVSWTIWSWNQPGSCAQPSVLADMNGTPLAGQGQLIHDRLMSFPG